MRRSSKTNVIAALVLSALVHGQSADAKPTEAKKTTCPETLSMASAEARLRLAALLNGLGDVQYSWGAFKWNTPYMIDLKIPRDFTKDTKIGDLADKNGNLLVFRVILGGYRPDWKEKGSFAATQGGYSYTLSPSIGPKYTTGKLDKDPHVLIALQNVKSDKLFYPFVRDFQSGKDPWPNENRGLEIVTSPTGSKSAHSWVDLTLDTEVERLNGYTEIKVPIGNENVIGVLPAKAFNQIMKQYKNKRFLAKDFIKKILASPDLQSL